MHPGQLANTARIQPGNLFAYFGLLRLWTNYFVSHLSEYIARKIMRRVIGELLKKLRNRFIEEVRGTI